MTTPGLFVEAADPAATAIVSAIASKHVVDFFDQLDCVSSVFFILALPEQLEKVADRKGIGPKIPLLIPHAPRQAGSHCEVRHQSRRHAQCAVRDHFAVSLRIGRPTFQCAGGTCPASANDHEQAAPTQRPRPGPQLPGMRAVTDGEKNSLTAAAEILERHTADATTRRPHQTAAGAVAVV